MVGLVLVVAGVLCLGLYQLYVSITTKKKLPDGAKPLPGPMSKFLPTDLLSLITDTDKPRLTVHRPRP